MDFKDKIRSLRVGMGATLEQIGNEVGVSKATVKRWESGEIANIRRDKIYKLAQALHTTPAYLMGWDDEQPPSVSAEGLSDIKRELIEKIYAMDDETVAALNRIADQVLSLRDK